MKSRPNNIFLCLLPDLWQKRIESKQISILNYLNFCQRWDSIIKNLLFGIDSSGFRRHTYFYFQFPIVISFVSNFCNVPSIILFLQNLAPKPMHVVEELKLE